MSLIDLSQIDEAFALLQQKHQDLLLPVTGYKENNIVTLVTDSNFNSAYGVEQDNVTRTTAVVSAAFSGCVGLMRETTATTKTAPPYIVDNIPSRNEGHFIEVKLDASGANFLKDCKQVNWNNSEYEIYGATRPVGLFGRVTHYVTLCKLMM